MIDRKDWNSDYINRTNWILGHLARLKVSAHEALVILVINYLNEIHKPITYEDVIDMCHLDADVVDDCFTSLSDKGYLAIDSRNGRLDFLLDGLVNLPVEQDLMIRQPIIKEFEEEFGKTLSGMQMEKIAQLVSDYGERMVIRALDEAAAYDKRSLEYVENVLLSWRGKGLTTEDVENGKR